MTQFYTILAALVAIAAVYLVPWLFSRRKAEGWPAAKKPPAGTIQYIAEIRQRMNGVRYVEILEALEFGETPDEASQRAARAFHDLYMAGKKPEEGEASE